ncbi:MAG: endonuclease Q family protein [Patescibacteria group bacterium]|jgi:uncharacterized protein (TIGR00375 family)
MRIIADFHIHSKYSRATSRDMDIDHIATYAKYKGIDLVGTGDFTHPFWFSNLKEKLMEDGSGILKLKNSRAEDPKFILTAEISNMYNQGSKGRRVHTVLVAPNFTTVAKIIDRLTNLGKLYSDGRPILGISAKDLAKIILEINPQCLIIPAHAWTPWFSIFGSNSGFDSIKECYEELSNNIYSIETGLSSDPEMNWRLSALDKITLISNSDAHSPANLGREANVFELDKNNFTYNEIANIIKTKDPKRFLNTIEFYPEEGKYHFDGHRNCNLVANPFETKYPDNICPKCGRKLTIGVLNRVEELADRPVGFQSNNFPGSVHLVPLLEIIAEALKVTPSSQKVQQEYLKIINTLGSEFKILLDLGEGELKNNLPPQIAAGIMNARIGQVETEPGYDGVYGKVKVLSKNTGAPSQESLF